MQSEDAYGPLHNWLIYQGNRCFSQAKRAAIVELLQAFAHARCFCFSGSFLRAFECKIQKDELFRAVVKQRVAPVPAIGIDRARA